MDETHLADESGNKVVLKGIMVPELSKIRSEKKLNSQFFDEVFAFGGNVIRIPVHPQSWEQDEYYLWRYLDPVVEWAVRNHRYVILDMHLIGNVNTGAGEEMPSSDARAFAVGMLIRTKTQSSGCLSERNESRFAAAGSKLNQWIHGCNYGIQGKSRLL